MISSSLQLTLRLADGPRTNVDKTGAGSLGSTTSRLREKDTEGELVLSRVSEIDIPSAAYKVSQWLLLMTYYQGVEGLWI